MKICFKERIINIIILILGVTLSLIPFVIAPVCPPMKNGMRMSCYYSGTLVMYLGISIILISILTIAIKSKKICILLNIVNIIIASIVHLVPHGIIKIQYGYNPLNNMPKFFAYCSKDNMSCVMHNTFVISSIFAGIIILLSVISIIYLVISKKEKKNENN